jgi:hypothetical protein
MNNNIYIEFTSDKTLNPYIVNDIKNVNNHYRNYFDTQCINFDEVIIKNELIDVNDIYIKDTFADNIIVYLILPINKGLKEHLYISYFDNIIVLGHPDVNFYFCKIRGNFKVIYDKTRSTLKKYKSSKNILNSLLHEEYMASNDIRERTNFFINEYIKK